MAFPPDEPPGVGGTAFDPAGELATTILYTHKMQVN